jgi:hypothetical protein
MRTFFRAHWKAIVAIILLVVLALFTVNPGAAVPELPLSSRLRSHLAAIASDRHEAARYIADVLGTEGYAIRREAGNIEATVANLAPNSKPARIFIVGVSVGGDTGGDTGGSGSAAVLELARLLKDLRPSLGTEVKFVFFVNGQPRSGVPASGSPDRTSFIAFVGAMESARQVQDALSAFRAVSDVPVHGLAAPAYVQGVTLSNHTAVERTGYPAIVVTDTGFLRYPYCKMNADETAGDTPDTVDYESTARVVQGLARTITALAAGAQG